MDMLHNLTDNGVSVTPLSRTDTIEDRDHKQSDLLEAWWDVFDDPAFDFELAETANNGAISRHEETNHPPTSAFVEDSQQGFTICDERTDFGLPSDDDVNSPISTRTEMWKPNSPGVAPYCAPIQQPEQFSPYNETQPEIARNDDPRRSLQEYGTGLLYGGGEIVAQIPPARLWVSMCPTVKPTLTQNGRKHNTAKAKRHQCPWPCGLNFTYPKDRDRHIRSKHTDDRPYKCTMPGCEYHTRGFTRRDVLNRHVKIKHEKPVGQ